MISALHDELLVLSRAVAFRNLSSAAVRVGLSQPQLSRIIARLEAGLGVTLLDRSSRRHSAWTAEAFALTAAFARASQRFELDLRQAVAVAAPAQLRIATLEGLAPLASEFCEFLVERLPSVTELGLDVHDLHGLEASFQNGDYDLVFASRMPGNRKFRFARQLGAQTLEFTGASRAETGVLSRFERQTQARFPAHHAPKRWLVSNSLAVRRSWIEDGKGAGYLPSEVNRRARGGVPVLLVGTEILREEVWEVALEF